MAQDQNTLAHFPFISGYQCASPPRGATSQPVVRGSGWPAAAPLRFVRVTHVRRATDPAPAARAYAGTRRKQASPAGRPSQRSYVPGRLHLRMRCVCACLSYLRPCTRTLSVCPLSLTLQLGRDRERRRREAFTETLVSCTVPEEKIAVYIYLYVRTSAAPVLSNS